MFRDLGLAVWGCVAWRLGQRSCQLSILTSLTLDAVEIVDWREKCGPYFVAERMDHFGTSLGQRLFLWHLGRLVRFGRYDRCIVHRRQAFAWFELAIADHLKRGL